MPLHDAIEGQMMEVKGVGRRRTQLLDDLRNRREDTGKMKIKEEDGNNSLSIKHKEEIPIHIFHKSMDLLISSILNNNNNNNNNNTYYNFT